MIKIISILIGAAVVSCTAVAERKIIYELSTDCMTHERLRELNLFESNPGLGMENMNGELIMAYLFDNADVHIKTSLGLSGFTINSCFSFTGKELVHGRQIVGIWTSKPPQ